MGNPLSELVYLFSKEVFMLTMRYHLCCILLGTLLFSACKHIPRGDVALPVRHVYLPHEQVVLPSQVVLPDGDVVQMPESCAERFALVQKALLQDLEASPTPWIVDILEHDSLSISKEDSVIQTGYAPAQDLLARITLEGDGVAKNSAKAFSLALDAARQDYTKAQIFVATLYMAGRGIARDDEQAFHWLREAAHEDIEILESTKQDAANNGIQSQVTNTMYYKAEAMLMLADAYRQGRGTLKDDEEAFLWTYKAAQAGNTRAFWWLGLHYYYGWGTPRDIALARALLKPFAEAGDAEALSLLEEME